MFDRETLEKEFQGQMPELGARESAHSIVKQRAEKLAAEARMYAWLQSILETNRVPKDIEEGLYNLLTRGHRLGHY
jgi:hypothetical protein